MVRISETRSQIKASALWCPYTFWCLCAMLANRLLKSFISVAANMHFQTHCNSHTVSHFVTTVPICDNSLIDSEPRVHVSLFCWLRSVHSGTLSHICLFSNSSIDSDIRFFELHIRGRFVSTVLLILTLAVDVYQQFCRFWDSRCSSCSRTVDLCTQFYRFWHSALGALRLGGVFGSLGCWFVCTVLQLLTCVHARLTSFHKLPSLHKLTSELG